MKKKTIAIILIVALSICALLANAFLINPHTTKIREETIESSKISKDLDNTLIAYFSDLKYSSSDSEVIADALDNLKSFNPDVIIFGGDLLGKDYHPSEEKEQEIVEMLSKLMAPLGKYAVLGDEDNNEQVHDILEQSGFRILNNASNKIYCGKNYFELVGIESCVGGNPDVEKAFEDVNGEALVMVYTHCGDEFDELGNYPCDYFLAGHSLGGGVYLPIVNLFYRPEGSQKYFHGSDTVGGSIIDITNGVGLGKQKARLFADSEIVLYKLRSAS